MPIRSEATTACTISSLRGITTPTAVPTSPLSETANVWTLFSKSDGTSTQTSIAARWNFGGPNGMQDGWLQRVRKERSTNQATVPTSRGTTMTTAVPISPSSVRPTTIPYGDGAPNTGPSTLPADVHPDASWSPGSSSRYRKIQDALRASPARRFAMGIPQTVSN